MKNRILPTLVVAALLAALSSVHAADKKPNFLFILVDDLGRQDMSCEGSAFHETPNIDRIASEAMRFSNGYSACQVCSPSRAAIQTGKYPARAELAITDYIGGTAGRNQPDKWNRMTKLLPARYEMEMKLGEVTIAEALKEHGYKTFFAGKWHLGHEGHGPEDRGMTSTRAVILRARRRAVTFRLIAIRRWRMVRRVKNCRCVWGARPPSSLANTRTSPSS
jgi:arylsulfatase A-like enzyme